MDGLECFDEDQLPEDNDSKFFGCYILVSLNPKHKGRTYIGFTVNPNRRIRQHNAGQMKGGAKSTAGKGPWEMVLIVHGFPNSISALRFEWAWQNPDLSRRLSHQIPPRKSKESAFDFKLRVLSIMLCSGPWNRLGLVIRWIKQEYARAFSEQYNPPLHMAFAYGPVPNPAKSNGQQLARYVPEGVCQICGDSFMPGSTTSFIPILCPANCSSGQWHLLCIARHMTQREALNDNRDQSPSNYLVPLSGKCPACDEAQLFWPSLIEMWKRRCTNSILS